jgi:putative membrane protein
MSAVHSALAKDRASSQAQNDGDDATVKVANAVAHRFTGTDIPPRRRALAGSIVHYAFGATMGAVYGGGAEIVPLVSTGLGVPFGAAVWLGAHVVTVPALGLAEPPTRRPLAAESTELMLHLLYGLTTELARRIVRARL